MIEILYFAWVRERIGISAETIELPPAATTVADLLDFLSGRTAGHAAALSDRTRIRVAVEQQFATADTIVGPGMEIAIFPPVTGG